MKKTLAAALTLMLVAVSAGCTTVNPTTAGPTQTAAQASPTPGGFQISLPTAAPTTDPAAAAQPDPTEALMPVTVESQQMTLSFYFGDRTGTYSGETVNGLPNGYGTFSTQNEDEIPWTYEGEWADGHFEGEGATYWDDGFWETGTYAYDALNGSGAEYWGDAVVYEGNYLDGTYDGYGKLYNILGIPMYIGDFSNGFIDESEKARSLRLETYQAQCLEIDYEDYMYDSSYVGTDIAVSGIVFYIWPQYEGDEYYGSFLMYEPDNPDNIIEVNYNYSLGETTIQDDTTVMLWGTMTGYYTYTTEDGRELTVPQIQAWNILQGYGVD